MSLYEALMLPAPQVYNCLMSAWACEGQWFVQGWGMKVNVFDEKLSKRNNVSHTEMQTAQFWRFLSLFGKS